MGARRRCTFAAHPTEANAAVIDLSPLLEDSVLQLRKEMPLELVVSMFQKLNLRHILFSQEGKLTGMVTKTDMVRLFTAQFPYTAALSEKPW